ATIDVSFCEAGDVTLAAGGVNAYSMIGHGGEGLSAGAGGWNGNITFADAVNVSLQGGTGTDSAAQIGHGGRNTTAALSGDIDLAGSGNLAVLAGSGDRSYAQIGLGGRSNTG